MCAFKDLMIVEKGARFKPWMPVRIILTALLLSGAAIFFSGCQDLDALWGTDPENASNSRFILPEPVPALSQTSEERLGYLYYADVQHRFLVPVRRYIPWVENIATATLLRLTSSPDSAEELRQLGLSPTLPAQTRIDGMSINDSQARINFSAEFLKYPPEHERLVLGSILSSLRQFSNIETVEFLVEGEKVDRFPGGAPGQLPLETESYINLELDTTVEDYSNITAVTLFFCYLVPNGRILYVPVTRALPPAEDIETAAVRELLKGPRPGSGLFSDLPTGTELLSFRVEEGRAVLDLSGEFLTFQGGRTGAENMVNQILLTLSLHEEIEQVQILVEGIKVTLEGLDLTNPLTPPEVFNYF
jgi:germination protein M